MDKVVDWLKKYWFLLAAFSSISVAYGQATVKLQTLEEAVKENASTSREIREIKSQMDRTDERTKALIESQVRQERMIEMLLSNQQRMSTSQRLIQSR